METDLRVYADATSLIGLSRVDRLDLLTLLPCPIYVTKRVWEEVTTDLEKPGVAALLQGRDDGLLAVVAEGDPDAFPQLDSGESTVLTAAAAARAAVIIDERRARKLIETDPNRKTVVRQPMGVIGLILLGKRPGAWCRRTAPAGRPDSTGILDQRGVLSRRTPPGRRVNRRYI